MTRIEKLLKTMDDHYDEQGEMYDPEKDIRAFLAERDEAVIEDRLIQEVAEMFDNEEVAP